MANEHQEIVPVNPAEGYSLAKPLVVDAAVRAEYGPPQGNVSLAEREDDGVELIEYWRLLRRRQGTLVLLTFLGLIAGMLVTLPQSSVYQAKTSLELLNLNDNFMNMKDVEQWNNELGYSLTTDIQTQIKILQSDMLLDRVTKEMQHSNTGALSEASDSGWRKLFNLPAPAMQRTPDKPLQMARKELKVRAAGQTQILEVLVDSTDPKVASEFANRLAQDYIEENVQSRWEMTQKTGDFLAKQLDDMRAKLERSEDQMQNYAQRNGLLFTDEKTNVNEDRLKDLQVELTKAQADRVESQSRWEMASTAAPDTLPDVLNDSTLRQYEEKLADLTRQKAELGESFTGDYSKVKRVDAQIAAVQQSVDLKRTDILKQIKNEYDEASRRELLLQQGYSQQTAIVNDQAGKAIQYNILRREVDTNRELYESMLQKMKEASVAGALRASNVRVVDPAKVPPSPYKPVIWLNALLGLLGGAFVGVAYIVTTEKADRMLQEPTEVAFYLGVPELGVIPAEKSHKDYKTRFWGRVGFGNGKQSGGTSEETVGGVLRESTELVTWQNKPSLMAESFRAALTSVLFTGQNGDQPKMLVVTSPNPGEGKTTVITNLAIALAETGQRVLLIDADTRKPRLHAILGLNNDYGLTTVLKGDAGRQEENEETSTADPWQETMVPGLFVLTAGPTVAGPTNLLYAKHFPARLRRYQELFDMVLLDTPPMLTIPDARVLGKLSHSVLLVVRAGKTTRDAAVAARMRLKADGIRVLGTIMNDWNPKHSRGGYYGYYDGYSPYYSKYSGYGYGSPRV